MKDNTEEQFRQIWASIEDPSTIEYQLQVYRLKEDNLPDSILPGLLRTFYLPITIPDIIEQIGRQYGGGKFQIKIVDGAGKYVKAKQFEISGLPKDGSEDLPVIATSGQRVMLFRNEPQTLKGVKIGGYLETCHGDQPIERMRALVAEKYGGGIYQLRIVDEQGKYMKSTSFTVTGFPKVPGLTDQKLAKKTPKKVTANPKKAQFLKNYQVGDKLTHKCGQLMVIEEVRKDSLLCSWADPFGNAQKNVFPMTEFKKSRKTTAIQNSV